MDIVSRSGAITREQSESWRMTYIAVAIMFAGSLIAMIKVDTAGGI